MGRKRHYNRSAVLNNIRVQRYRLKRNVLGEHQENQRKTFGVPLSGDTDTRDIRLQDMLRSWAIQHNITTRAINDLLNVLNQYGKLKILIFNHLFLCSVYEKKNTVIQQNLGKVYRNIILC